MDGTTTKLEMNAIGIVTADMPKSLEFYGLLDLNVPAYDPSQDHFDCELPNGLRIMWDTVELVKGFMPGYVHGSGSGIGFAFQCASPAGVDAVYERVIAAGFSGSNPPWDAFWGMRYAILTDPDGNAVSLYALLG